ncbi:unnamed protein product [Clavelina lepadiformis]|uniref:Secreted protein n=1 Tax=Clavelina lepadiformis TaxID=159417 RepID=A0ABP0H3G8_CLALP
MKKITKILLFVCYVLYMTEAVQVNQRKPDYSKMLMQALTKLMVCDYNRITTKNARFYTTVNGYNSFQCRQGDISQCQLTLTLMPTDCRRTDPDELCAIVNGETKTCSGEVDMYTGVISAPLNCKDEENDLDALLAQFGLDANILNPRKKWDEDDGNPHPW